MKIQKINKKSGEYKLTGICNTNDYAFIIDGSMPFNKQNFLNYLYIINIKIALKKYLIEKDPAKAVLKTEKYVNEKFKKYYKHDFPLISLGIYKKENDKLQVLILNNIKCYIKQDRIKVLENKKFNNLKSLTKTEYKKNFNKLNDFNNYICYETEYEKALSILFCNKGFQNYQDYLNLKNKDFLELVENQGLKNCSNNLKRIETKDVNKKEISRYKQIEDKVALYKMLL